MRNCTWCCGDKISTLLSHAFRLYRKVHRSNLRLKNASSSCRCGKKHRATSIPAFICNRSGKHARRDCLGIQGLSPQLIGVCDILTRGNNSQRERERPPTCEKSLVMAQSVCCDACAEINDDVFIIGIAFVSRDIAGLGLWVGTPLCLSTALGHQRHQCRPQNCKEKCIHWLGSNESSTTNGWK